MSEEELKSIYVVKPPKSGHLRDHMKVSAVHRCPPCKGFLENQ